MASIRRLTRHHQATASRSSAALLVAVLVVSVLTQNKPSIACSKQQEDPSLAELVRSFFLEDHPGRRRTIRSQIERASNRSIERVIDEVRNVQLWSKPQETQGEFTFESAGEGTVRVHYRIPTPYDPSRVYPAIVCVHSPNPGTDKKFPYDFFDGLLGSRTKEFFVLVLSKPLGHRFHQPVACSYDMPLFVRDVRQRFHLDTNRTLLFGIDSGGFSTWTMAAQNPHLFAGLFTCNLPSASFDPAFLRILPENLHSTPFLWIRSYGRGMMAQDERFVDGWMGALVPTVPWSRTSEGAIDDVPSSVRDFLDRRRKTPVTKISYWFRYPGQGEIDWLKQTKFAGPIWEEEQLSILPSAGTDRNNFSLSTVKSMMAYLGAEVAGQTINIETKMCARVEVLLPPDLVDLDRPVTIRINGKRRLHERVKPSIRVLLDTAYKRWDFQRLAVAQLSFSVRSDTKKP